MNLVQITASALDRIDACPASPVLPQVRETSKPALRGQAIHAFLENAAKMGREDALLEVPDEYRMVCESIDLEELPPLEGLSPEVALAYIPDTGDAIALDGVEGREYGSLPAGAIPGTADLIGLLDDDAVFIGDYKTGWTAPRAETSLQIRMYALMAARAYGRSRAVVEIIHLRTDDSVWRDRVELSAFDLSAFEGRLREAILRVDEARKVVEAGQTPSVTRGDHCTYCPAYRSCPATLALARELGADPAGTLEGLRAEDPKTAAVALDRLKQIKKVLKLIEEELKAYATREPFTTLNGKTYGARPWTVRDVDVQIAYDVLAEAYTPELADAACPRKATLKSIEDAVKPVAKAMGVKMAPFVREAMAKLEAEGAITVSQTQQVREH